MKHKAKILIADLLILAGLAAATFGICLVFMPAGVVFGGAALVGTGVMLGRSAMGGDGT